MRIGTVQVYTGNGKGKTTAAIGQALRAVGHGLKVIMIQFMKGKINYGELIAAKNLSGFTIEQYGLPTFVDKNKPSQEDKELAKKGFKRAKMVIKSGDYDMVILDEINVAIDYGLVSLSELLELIKTKPKNVELILTGRYAPKEEIEIADLVTDMKEIKHHYQKGIQSREGIEY
ncbi:MAG: cob(I)yrinic acid a,c-diamide adenosyltransferase [bacterium]|nr:cob(I)yrinic acid a,c-diamide adenosyltransferase [bacterium]